MKQSHTPDTFQTEDKGDPARSGGHHASTVDDLFPPSQNTGPIIRKYLSEQFRRRIYSLNDALTAVLSPQKVKWWIEAKRSGRDFAEYCSYKSRGYLIESVLIIDRATGALQKHCSRNESAEEDNTVLDTLCAIASYLDNSFAREASRGRLSVGGKNVYLATGNKSIVAVIVEGTPPVSFENLLSECEPVDTDLQKLLTFSGPVYRKPSLWRVWLLAGLLCFLLLLAAGRSIRHSIIEDRMESAIRQEPGFELLHSSSQPFSKNRISILRDPLARNTKEVFAENRVPRDFFSVSETPFISLEEPFASQRAREAVRKDEETREHLRSEIAALYREIENLSSKTATKEDHLSLIRSEFYRLFPIQNTAELVWMGGNNWELVGTATEPYYSEIVELQQNLVIGGGKVSIEKLKKHLPDDVEILRKEINRLFINYRGTSVQITPQGFRTRSLLVEKLTKLVLLHQTNRMPLPEIELHATPIAGVRQAQNLSIASSRLRIEAHAIRNSPVGSKIKLTTFLDSVTLPNQSGVYAVVK